MTTADKKPTYAELWADAINETYSDDWDEKADMAYDKVRDDHRDEDDFDWEKAVSQTLSKAADILRGYAKTATFTGAELDLVRHLMPAHEVHQSGSVRWVRESWGYCGKRKSKLDEVMHRFMDRFDRGEASAQDDSQ